MSEEKKMPIMDDFLKALENRNETEIADQMRQSMIACGLLNLVSDVSLPTEMNEKLEVYREPKISQCIVCDTVDDIPNSSTN